MSMRLSAIICTHNRAAYLRKAIQSLADQTLDQELYEIIVVDNASDDNTKQIIDGFSFMNNFRYIYEPVLGLSRARNTGWQNARGKYVAYLDDDAVACEQWLEKIYEVFDTFEPSPGTVGGKVEGIWETPRPDWLSDKLLTQLALVDWSDVPIILEESQFLPGCNIAFPTWLIEKAGGFRENLGRQGTKLGQHEETHLRNQIESWGYRSVYHPEIAVGHHIHPSRLNKSWFRRVMYWNGLSEAILLDSERDLSDTLRAWLSLTTIGWILPRLLLMCIAVNSAPRFRRQCQFFKAMGYLSGLWRWHQHQ